MDEVILTTSSTSAGTIDTCEEICKSINGGKFFGTIWNFPSSLSWTNYEGPFYTGSVHTSSSFEYIKDLKDKIYFAEHFSVKYELWQELHLTFYLIIALLHYL